MWEYIRRLADLFLIFLGSYLIFYMTYGIFVNPNILRPIKISCGPQALMIEECYKKRWNPIEYGKCLNKVLEFNESQIILNLTIPKTLETHELYLPKYSP